MKLGFEESQSPYDSGSQSARFWTEKWVEKSLYCPNCGNPKLEKLPNNQPVGDFKCSACIEEFELKSQKAKFGSKVLDGAYRTMSERISKLAWRDMAWFANHYTCARCSETWTDEWSCMCDDDCPHCGARHMSPDDSEDLTGIIDHEQDAYVVLWSPDSAEDSPVYEEVARFRSEKRAKAYLDRLLHVAT